MELGFRARVVCCPVWIPKRLRRFVGIWSVSVAAVLGFDGAILLVWQ